MQRNKANQYDRLDNRADAGADQLEYETCSGRCPGCRDDRGLESRGLEIESRNRVYCSLEC